MIRTPDVISAVRRLAHDVGKYVARTARNVHVDDAWSPDLVRMLCRDLYELPGGRASAVFEALATPIDEALGKAALAPIRALLVEIDGAEPAVRRAEPHALKDAARLARQVDDQLRDFIRGIQEPTP